MIDLLTVFGVFARLGLLSFGSVNLAAMGQAVVEQQHWLTQAQFAQGYALGQLLPGPNVLCILLYGYAASGLAGSLAALSGFFLPPALVVLTVFIFTQRGSPLLARLYRALLPLGAGLLLAGLVVLARGSVTGAPALLVALLSFALVRFTRVPPILVVLLGLGLGVVLRL
ncbi:chromate transporter [Deinococcus sp. KNUC1210]|uniref:chromate transporter n=1 Tax=Deinococcus sp. KNUC1210 TaxID=2917691 RepID=UPI001EEFF26D|nr:chromate transporter [Deinococcus sp. KNUC1210]ULH16413.1 chromate transporter [Deinococcus sp. KNUC1210]